MTPHVVQWVVVLLPAFCLCASLASALDRHRPKQATLRSVACALILVGMVCGAWFHHSFLMVSFGLLGTLLAVLSGVASLNARSS